MNSSDRTLIEKWTTRRDADAFAEIVSRYSGMVYATCLRILRNGSEAEEVAQECFLKLATGGTVIRSSLGGWLHKLATDRSLNRARADNRRQMRERKFVENAVSGEASWDDIQSHVDEAIAALPEKLRGSLVGHFLEGQTYDELAKTLGIPRSTAASRVQKGLETVRKVLKKRGIPISAAGLATLMAAHTTHAAPASLAATLGKLALAGTAGSGASVGGAVLATAGAAKLLGGISVTKVAALVTTVILVGGVGIWTAKQKHQAERVEPAQEIRVMENEERPSQPGAIAPQALGLLARETGQDEPAASRSVPEEPLATETANVSEGASIKGKLVDSSRNPIGNWNVFAARMAGRGKFEVTSVALAGDDGGFLITELDGGEYRLYAVPRPQEGVHFSVRNQETVIRLAENENKKGVILVFDEGLTISGRVIDSEERPIPGATVYAEPVAEVRDSLVKDVMTENALQKTDLAGNFRLIALLDAEYHVRAMADGYKWTRVDNVPAGTDGLEIVLKGNEVRLAGRVVDARTGNPVTDFGVAYVTGVVEEWEPWLDRREYRLVSDPQGRFEFFAGHYAGALTILARAQGYAPGLEPLQGAASGAVEDVTIRLEQGLTLEGTVVHATGAPVAGAHVFVGLPPNPKHMGYEQGASTTSAKDGTFMITSLRPEDRFVSAALHGHVPGVASIPAAISRGVARAEIVLPPEGGRITGTIMEGGQPISGCEVQVYTQYPPLGQQDHFGMGVRTDESGRYSVDDLPEMRMTVATVFHLEEASYGQSDVWLVTEADVEAGKETEVSFNFVPGDACIEGRVLVDGRIPATRASVLLISYDPAGTREIHPTRTNEEGFYALRWLPEGNAELAVGVTVHGKYEEWTQQITLRGGETATYDINIGD